MTATIDQSGAATNPSVNTTGGVTGNPPSMESLSALLARVQIEKARVLEEEVRAKAIEVNERNILLNQANEFLQQARKLETEADQKNKGTIMPPEMVVFFEEHGISWDENSKDHKHKDKHWQFNIKNLQAKMDNWSSTTSLSMTEMQSKMGNFNNTVELVSATEDGNQNMLSKITANI